MRARVEAYVPAARATAKLLDESRHAYEEGSQAVAARSLSKRGAEIALADAGGANDDDVLLGARPPAGRELADEGLLEAACGVDGYVFEDGAAGAELGLLQSSRQATVVSVVPLAVDEHADLLLKRESVAGSRREDLA